ncbi:MAG TPA: addiction module protein [Chthoniobacteraceae bacterium]|jgi:putative addiction module component (TIGR02574 family)|nr:addiction module protein [Chthoniobacteraceae bacterium]
MALEDVVKVALELPEDDRLKLAGVLLDSADAEAEDEVSAAWEEEIQARIRAIDEGRVTGIPHEEAMRWIKNRLTRER